jgi:hypothetical protein
VAHWEEIGKRGQGALTHGRWGPVVPFPPRVLVFCALFVALSKVTRHFEKIPIAVPAEEAEVRMWRPSLWPHAVV